MWDRELVGLLISKYQEHENLYNINKPEYVDREMRSYSWSSICQDLQTLNKKVTVSDIKKKIHTLRTQFAKEVREIAKSKRSGDVYIPKLWCFSQLQFLQGNTVGKNPESNIVSQSNCLEINQNCCRICLEKGAIVDWNNEILDSCKTTYKYCYFKYTQLDENVPDELSQMLCKTCSKSLKNFHLLIEKALESYNILQQTLATPVIQPSESGEKFDIKNEETYESVEFEILNFEKSTELFEDDYDTKKLLPMFPEEALEICMDLKPKEENETTKEETSNKYSKILKKYRDNKKSKDNKINLKTDNKFPKDVEEMIDIPDPADVEQEMTDIPDSGNVEQEMLDISDPGNVEQEMIDIPYPENVEQNVVIPKARPKRVRKKQIVDYRKIMCAYCPKLVSIQHMKRHEQTHKENRTRSCICTICGLKFLSKSSLYNHMRVHNKNREKKFKCEFCSKSYFDRGTLNIHRRIHLGQLVSCPICQKEFYRQIDLDVHRARTHDANIADKNFDTIKYYIECKECGKNIVSNRFKHHIAQHSNKFQMKCTLCDKHFVSKRSCHKHVRKAHKYEDEFANVVEYYGEEMNFQLSHLLLKQTQIVKPKSEVEMEQ